MAKNVVSTVAAPTKFSDVQMRGHNTLLTIDGIEGFSEFAEKAIDVVFFEFVIGLAGQADNRSGGHGTSRVNFDGIKVRKAIDKATPLLFKALVETTHIKNIAIHLYRDPPEGGKDTEMYMTISMGDVRVIRQALIDPEGTNTTAGGKPYEEVTFGGNSVEVNHTIAKKVASFLATQGA